MTNPNNPWTSDYTPTPQKIRAHIELTAAESDDDPKFSDLAAATAYYAGPFCACGDYSCPASNDPAADCVNYEGPDTYTGYYPETWTDEDIAAYEFEMELIRIKCEEAEDTQLAADRLNELGRLSTTTH